MSIAFIALEVEMIFVVSFLPAKLANYTQKEKITILPQAKTPSGESPKPAMVANNQ